MRWKNKSQLLPLTHHESRVVPEEQAELEPAEGSWVLPSLDDMGVPPLGGT